MSGERTTTKPQQTTQQAPQKSQEIVNVPARIRYPAKAFDYGITQDQWDVLVNAVYPSAKTMEGVLLAIAYCKSRNLDIFKRPVHIVPMNTKIGNAWKTIETIWPGINELRTTAFRTGKYAGCDAEVFGPDKTSTWEYAERSNESDDGGGHPNAPPSDDAPKKAAAAPKKVVTVIHPEWCRITVYRMIDGQRVAFPGPRVYWLESYATMSRFNDAPNEMWKDRPRGQLAKCSEAASLRKAFPEELGGEYTIDEAPRMVDITPGVKVGDDDVPDKRPDRSSISETAVAKAARAKAAEPKVVDHDPETGEILDDKAAAQPKQTERQNAQPSDSGPPEMSEELESALAALARNHNAEEIQGMLQGAKADLTPDDFAVFNNAALQSLKRLGNQQRK